MRRGLAGVALVLLTGCAGAGGNFFTRLDRATDARVREPAEWHELRMLAASPQQRAALARAVGWTRDPGRVADLLSWLDGEPDRSVRAEILFSLGQIPDERAVSPLILELRSPSPALRSRAAAALGKLGNDEAVDPLLHATGDADPRVRSSALLALTRLRGRRARARVALPSRSTAEMSRALQAALDDPDAEVAWRAVYALSEIEIDGRMPALMRFAEAPDPRSRLFAVRGLARLTDHPEKRARFFVARLPHEQDPHAAAALAAALGELQGDQTAPVTALLAAARRRGHPADHHVRAAAVRSLGVRLGEAGGEPRRGEAVDGEAPAVEALRALWKDPSALVRGAAYEALARVHPEDAFPLLLEILTRPAHRQAGQLDSPARSATRADDIAATRALTHITHQEADDLLVRLCSHDDPAVAGAALTALADRPRSAGQAAAEARVQLARDDVAVRGSALAVLRRHGDAGDLEAYEAAYRNSPGPDWVEARVELVAAAAALEDAAPVPFLRRAALDPSPAVRAAAVAALQERGEPGSLAAAPPAGSSRPSSVALDTLPPSSQRVRARLETTRGAFVIELLGDAAPRHVRSFIQRAEQGRYDGLVFHRIVSGFVAQGLDPRGDGWGSGGVFLRDEINAVPYLRGTVGMPNAGPDTAGSQIFITHVPTPHLDGRYTVFGRVVQGMEVVDALDVQDICHRVRILSP